MTSKMHARLIMIVAIAAALPAGGADVDARAKATVVSKADFKALRLAIEDLRETFGSAYQGGKEYSAELRNLRGGREGDTGSAQQEFRELQRRAMLANPLLDFDELIVLKRKRGQLGLPVNHKCNSGIERTGYDNELAILPFVEESGGLRTLYRPEGGEFVGEMDLHWNADTLLFTMPKDRTWQIYEIGVDGEGLRQVSRDEHKDVDNFDGCYLPDGRIVFTSTASYHAVPCWHGKERACAVYIMDEDGGNMRQLCFDQDLDLHPSVLPSGQVIFSRWDYSGTMHIYLRPLMVMNPDGTGQRAVYGSNSYWPNSLYFPRGIPGSPDKLISVLSGYHGVPRMGGLALIDLTRGWHEADGIVQMIPGRDEPIETEITDRLVDKWWPKFLHPYPLSDKYFLVSAQVDAKSAWGIYLVDVFDNMLPILVGEKQDFFEPIPLKKRAKPPVIPDRVDMTRDDAVVYLHDVYAGPGLAGVPRGTVKQLRIFAYHYGYPGMAGPDKIGSGGPWEAMRIIGTVEVAKDGSAMFEVPAKVPLSLQPLDAEGKAVQLMRSWFTAMPGETVSCVGCHEHPRDVPLMDQRAAALEKPQQIQQWYGPPRGFDFEREVQPVLDEHCVRCHNGRPREDKRRIPDLRAERFFTDYEGRELARLGRTRLHSAVKQAWGGTKIKYTPAYEALVPYIRRVNIEDDVELLVPGEYHADTSELIQMMLKGHKGVRLDREAWDRLVTWIDLNGPCHGAWGDVGPIPEGAAKRRRELAMEYGGPEEDPEAVPAVAHAEKARAPDTEGPALLMDSHNGPGNIESRRHLPVTPVALGDKGISSKVVDVAPGVRIELVRILAGRFWMGERDRAPDASGMTHVRIERDFCMGTCEVTNEQYRAFDPGHDSGLFTKRFQGPDGPGLSLNGSKHPVVRVSWQRAMEFCRWLSRKTGMRFILPTEAQWEYACRAGTQTDFFYGSADDDFSQWANVADKSLSVPPGPTGGLDSNINLHFGKGILESAVYGGVVVCDVRFDDGAVATAEVGAYRPNAWGLHDMHGNVCEWTRTTYRAYPYDSSDGREDPKTAGEKVVRGGSWQDRPKRCRSAFRLSYPAWQRVHNVGFRVVCEGLSSESSLVRVGGGD